MNAQEEHVLRTIEEKGVRFVRLWFTDIVGKLKSVAIAPAELEEAFQEENRIAVRHAWQNQRRERIQ